MTLLAKRFAPIIPPLWALLEAFLNGLLEVGATAMVALVMDFSLAVSVCLVIHRALKIRHLVPMCYRLSILAAYR